MTASGRCRASLSSVDDSRTRGDVHIVLDNTGSELALDLLLVDALLSLGFARVTLHVKMHPTFVSDATAGDVHTLFAALRRQGGAHEALAERLGECFAQERLRIWPDFFWNGPAPLAELPFHLRAPLEEATMVVLKGDANYRRAVGDALLPAATPFAEVTSYFRAPLLALRTLKSDAVVGLRPGARRRARRGRSSLAHQRSASGNSGQRALTFS